MQVKLSTSQKIFQTDSKVQQNPKESKVSFQSQNLAYKQQNLNADNYKAAFLSVHSLKKINEISFGGQLRSAEQTAERVAETLYKYRVQDHITPCHQNPCPVCIDKLKSKVLPFIEQNKPIQMLMICFPFKLPSRQKTLGVSPDKAEEIALKNLRKTIGKVEEVYKPEGKAGAEFVIYNDNLIFSTAELHPSDQEAREYQHELEQMSQKLGVNDRISFRTIENVDFFDGTDAPKDLDGKRKWLLDRFGDEYTEDKLKAKMAESLYYNNFVNGIMKFNQEIMKGIFVSAGEEALEKEIPGKLSLRLDERNYIHFIDNESQNILDKCDLRVKKAVDIINRVGQEALASKLGKSDNPYARITDANGQLRVVPTKTGKCKIHDMSFKVLHLDQSWVSFINHNTENRVRFSIHPQPCGSFKTGIELVPGNGWIQPWNSTAVDTGNGNFILAKSSNAKALGCEVVMNPATNRPSHYKIPENHPNKAGVVETLIEKRDTIRF